MSKPKVGGYEFNQELTRIRNAANEITTSLDIILNRSPGPQTIYAHIAQISIQIGHILSAVANLEKIGRNTKNERTGQ